MPFDFNSSKNTKFKTSKIGQKFPTFTQSSCLKEIRKLHFLGHLNIILQKNILEMELKYDNTITSSICDGWREHCRICLCM